MAGEAASPSALLDRIELRRFVGRELLLWLWFESEVLEATLATKEHGSFGLWLGGRLVLTDGRESTAIKGVSPGLHREAKEALLRGRRRTAWACTCRSATASTRSCCAATRSASPR